VSQTCKAQLRGHQGMIMALDWSPESDYLISGSDDETVRIWRLADQHCELLKPDYPYAGMNITDVVGLSDLMIASLKGLGAIQTSD